jgi:hypothetical protein
MPRDFNCDWALRLAEAGIAVFPCGPDKKPLVKWRTLSSSDPEAVARWWHQFPNALPGIDLEKCDLVVLDGDRHGGPDGVTALRDLLRQQPGFDIQTAPTVFTPNEGVHVYLAQNGHGLGNAEGDLPDGINVRGAGGYTIAPYAVLPNGRQYGTPDLITAVKGQAVPHVPQGIVDLIQARKRRAEPKGNGAGQPSGAATVREMAYAEAALQGCPGRPGPAATRN